MAISDLVFIDADGFHSPDYPTVLDYLKGEYKTIYGTDVYLEADSQDGQWIAIMALAIFDAIQVAADTYNSFSPLTAQRDALSRNVKINGIKRLIASYSQVDLVIVGQAGTTITKGQVEDTLGQKWNLPASVVVPVSGMITVTATAVDIGVVAAAANTVTKISTPTLGWQTVNNPLAAIPGNPVETDSELRKRQQKSVALPSLTVLEGIKGAIAAIPGVTRLEGYENDTDATDSDGIPEHSISLVVEGGDAQLVGNAIAGKKTPGTGTYGTTTVTTYDKYDVPNDINFFRPTVVTVGVEVTIKALQGYSTASADLIKSAVADMLNSLGIGDDVLVTKLYGPALLIGDAAYSTFDIIQIRVNKNGGAFYVDNVVVAFNEVAFCNAASDVSVIVT